MSAAEEPLPDYSSVGITVNKRLGSGTYGEVYSVTYKGLPFAMKVYVGVCPVAPTELDIASRIRSPYLTSIKTIIGGGTTPTGNTVILMPLALGDLYDIVDKKVRPSLNQRLRFLHECFQGVYALHVNGVVHFDLKLGNILYYRNGNTFSPLVSDFGLSKYVGDVQTGIDLGLQEKRLSIGTESYMPPEHYANRGIYGGFTDMWAMGVVTVRLLGLTGNLVVGKGKDEELYKYISEYADPQTNANRLNGIIRRAFSRKEFDEHRDNIRDLLAQLLNPDPMRRITVRGALIHPLFEGINKLENTYTLQDNIEFIKPPREFILITGTIQDYYAIAAKTERAALSMNNVKAIDFFEAISLAHSVALTTTHRYLDEDNCKLIGLACVALTLQRSCIDGSTLITKLQNANGATKSEKALIKARYSDLDVGSLKRWINVIVASRQGRLRGRNLFYNTTNIEDLIEYHKNLDVCGDVLENVVWTHSNRLDGGVSMNAVIPYRLVNVGLSLSQMRRTCSQEASSSQGGPSVQP